MCSRKSFSPLSRGLDSAHCVDDYQAVVALDHRQIPDVTVPDLVQVVRDLVQAALMDQLRLAPEAGIHRVQAARVLITRLAAGCARERMSI
jgi:hypothetical protein